MKPHRREPVDWTVKENPPTLTSLQKFQSEPTGPRTPEDPSDHGTSSL